MNRSMADVIFWLWNTINLNCYTLLHCLTNVYPDWLFVLYFFYNNYMKMELKEILKQSS